MTETIHLQPATEPGADVRKWSVDRPLVIELLGPAGSGKTTLLGALNRHCSNICSDVRNTQFEYAKRLCKDYLSFFPLHLRHHRHSRWFNWQESRSLVYIRAWNSELQRRMLTEVRLTVFDHGPMYRLASLRAWGPEIVSSQKFKRRWNDDFELWVSNLDLLVLLDAPNELLIERIRARKQDHLCKVMSEQRASDYLQTYRQACNELVSRFPSDGPKVLKIDTEAQKPNEIVDEIRGALNH